MTACPACGASVRPVWPTCRSCGTLLMAAPAPVAPIGAPVAVGAPTPSPEEQFFAPAVLQPAVQLPVETPPPYTHAPRIAGSGVGGKWIALIGVVVFFFAAVATAYFTLKPKVTKANEQPVVLAPRAPTAGLPTSLDAIVRIEAESTRHTALQTVEQESSGDVSVLAAAQPDYQWLAGDQPSTAPHDVSVAETGGVVTIAVSASNKDICAFGKWSTTSAPMYLTMEHEPTCAAVDAPAATAGWSTQPGGAASDLPDDNP